MYYLPIVVLKVILIQKKKYLDVLHEKKYTIALCQFRISAHHLVVERGRYYIFPDPKGNAKYEYEHYRKRVSFSTRVSCI